MDADEQNLRILADGPDLWEHERAAVMWAAAEVDRLRAEVRRLETACTTTLVACGGCGRGERARNLRGGRCPDCLAAALAAAEGERDAALAALFRTGVGTLGIDPETASRLAGETFRAWLAPDSVSLRSAYASDVRAAAGLAPAAPDAPRPDGGA